MEKPQKILVDVGKFIGKNKMPLIYVGGAIVVLVVAFPLLNKFVKGIKGTPNKVGKNRLVSLKVDESKTTISTQTAKQYSEQLFRAFQGTTDESMIKNIFSKINSEDFKKIAIAFDLRTYDYTNSGSPSGAFFGIFDMIGNKDDLDLVGWLNEELGMFDWSTKSIVRKVIEPDGFILN